MMGIAPNQARASGRAVGMMLGVSGVLLLAGCTLFHSNVRGGFSCAAPGGSCAPTSVIDDGAIRDIRNNEKTDHGGDLVVPVPNAAAPGAAEVIYPEDRRPRDGRSMAGLSGRMLRVTFPAHVDHDGKVVPQRLAYVLVDLPEWQDVRGEALVTYDGHVAQGASRGLLGAAQSAPVMLGSSDSAAPTGSAQPIETASAMPLSQTGASSAAVTSIDQIKAQAQQILDGAKTRNAGTFTPSGN